MSHCRAKPAPDSGEAVGKCYLYQTIKIAAGFENKLNYIFLQSVSF